MNINTEVKKAQTQKNNRRCVGQKEKIKKFPIVILIIVIILAIIVGYSVHGYKSGIEYAKIRAKRSSNTNLTVLKK